MPALPRPPIPHPSRVQVSLEKPVPHDKITDMRQTALAIQEDEVQFVLPHCLVVPFNDIDRLCVLVLVDRVDLA